MGKGSRNRADRADKRTAYQQPLTKAVSLERAVRVLCVLSLIVLALALFLPAWSVQIIAQNLAADAYSVDEATELALAVSVGRLSLVLLPLGTLITSILLWCRKAGWSLIGLALQVVGAAMLVAFAVALGNVFAFDPLAHSGHGQGLNFWDLALRYYILLLPFIMQIASVCMGFVARKKRDIADVMQQATDTSSTLSLDEEETTQFTP